MHVAKVSRKQVLASGEEKVYVSQLLRRTYRDGGKVKHETLANLSALPDAAIEAVRATLAGRTLTAADDQLEVTRSLPHGHVAAVLAIARQLGLPGLLGPPGRVRDLVLALILSRVCHPRSKLATTSWWADTTLGVDLGVAGASTDEVYTAMDYLHTRQDSIEKALAAKYLGPKVNPHRLALFDLSSSWMTGSHCPPAARGYSRDGKKGLPQIEYGMLTDPDGCPIAVQVFNGNTADPTAFISIVTRIGDTLGLKQLVMVGDRGMITSARISALREQGDMGWVTALRAPQIAALAADQGPLQMTLFDHTNLAEISHPDYPGERLIACRNPLLAAERDRKRNELLTATDTALNTISAAADAGRLSTAADIGVRVGKVIGRYKMAKHYTLTITDTTFTYTHNQPQIDAEKALDGIYLIRTTLTTDQMNTGQVVATYKSLAGVERVFLSAKSIDLDLRPVRHWTETRVRAHVLICMLAAHLVFHLRRAWTELTYTDENKPEPTDPVAPAQRSPAANKKAHTHTTTTGQPARSFNELLHHLATLTRNQIHLTNSTGTGTGLDIITTPTPTQRRAFQLLNTTIPTHLKP